MSYEHHLAECSITITFWLINWLQARYYNWITPCGSITENKLRKTPLLVPWKSHFFSTVLRVCLLQMPEILHPLSCRYTFTLLRQRRENQGCFIYCKYMSKSALASPVCVWFQAFLDINKYRWWWQSVETGGVTSAVKCHLKWFSYFCAALSDCIHQSAVCCFFSWIFYFRVCV